MSARNLIARRIGLWSQEIPDPTVADSIISALTTAGYSIIHDSENHGPTVERIATYLERQPSFGDGKWAARHVRAMTTGGGDAALPDEVRE